MTAASGSAKWIGVSALCALVLAGCTDEPTARRTAAVSGLTEVETTGYAWWGCGEKDTYHTGIVARGADGSCVEAIVCSGWMKGGTLRVLGPSSACRSTGLAAPQSRAPR